MATAMVTSKGQITIPASVRVALGIETGSRVEFIEIETGRYAIIAATSPMQALKGLLRQPEQAVSIADMNQAIVSQGAKAR